MTDWNNGVRGRFPGVEMPNTNPNFGYNDEDHKPRPRGFPYFLRSDADLYERTNCFNYLKVDCTHVRGKRSPAIVWWVPKADIEATGVTISGTAAGAPPTRWRRLFQRGKAKREAPRRPGSDVSRLSMKIGIIKSLMTQHDLTQIEVAFLLTYSDPGDDTADDPSFNAEENIRFDMTKLRGRRFWGEPGDQPTAPNEFWASGHTAWRYEDDLVITWGHEGIPVPLMWGGKEFRGLKLVVRGSYQGTPTLPLTIGLCNVAVVPATVNLRGDSGDNHYLQFLNGEDQENIAAAKEKEKAGWSVRGAAGDSHSFTPAFGLQGARTMRLFSFTFDDGLRSTFRYAFPMLNAFGMPATVGIITKFLVSDPSEMYLRLSETKQLEDWGWEIASHSVSHPNLDQIPKTFSDETADQWRQLAPRLLYTNCLWQDVGTVLEGDSHLPRCRSYSELETSETGFFFDPGRQIVYARCSSSLAQTSLRLGSAERELSESRAALEALGFNVRSFIAPYGVLPPHLRDLGAKYYKIIALAGKGANIAGQTPTTHLFRASARKDRSPDELIGIMERWISPDSWTIVCLHDILPQAAQTWDWNVSDLARLIQWVRGSGLQVCTLSAGAAEFEAAGQRSIAELHAG